MILESLKIATAGLVGVVSLVLAGMPEWASIYAMVTAAALIALGLSRE